MGEARGGYCYIKVTEDASEDSVELPSEDNGSLLLTTLQAQFPSCTGLRYKAEGSNNWRGIRLSNGVLSAPPEGWGNSLFHVVYPKTADSSSKRKIMEESPSHKEPEAKIVKTFGVMEEPIGDLIVLGLPFSANENDVRAYFQQFGEVELAEVKRNPMTSKSKGFGFVSFKHNDAARSVLRASHVIGGRKCEVRIPRQKEQTTVPYKVFVGRLPPTATEQDLRSYFSTYGELVDVYIPKPFRGFGFVTFASSDSAKDVMNSVHSIQGTQINITYAEPKGQKESPNFQNMMHMFGNMSSKGHMGMFSQMYPPNLHRGGAQGMTPATFQQTTNYNSGPPGDDYNSRYTSSGSQPPGSNSSWS